MIITKKKYNERLTQAYQHGINAGVIAQDIKINEAKSKTTLKSLQKKIDDAISLGIFFTERVPSVYGIGYAPHYNEVYYFANWTQKQFEEELDRVMKVVEANEWVNLIPKKKLEYQPGNRHSGDNQA